MTSLEVDRRLRRLIDEQTARLMQLLLTRAGAALHYQPKDEFLSALSDVTGLGLIVRTATGTAGAVARSLVAPSSGITISDPDGVAGAPTFALAGDLLALEGLVTGGLAARTVSGAWATRTLTEPSSGITIANPTGSGGNPTFALAGDLLALESLVTTGYANRGTGGWTTATGIPLSQVALSGNLLALDALASGGLTARTDSGAWFTRSLVEPASGITISEPTGSGGNPTFSLAGDLLALESLVTTGWANRGTGGWTTSTGLPLSAITLSGNLSELDALATGGVACRTVSGAWAVWSLGAPSSGMTITNPTGSGGAPTFALAGDLLGLESLVTTGYANRGTGGWTTAAGIPISQVSGISNTSGYYALRGTGLDYVNGRIIEDNVYTHQGPAPASTNPTFNMGQGMIHWSGDLMAIGITGNSTVAVVRAKGTLVSGVFTPSALTGGITIGNFSATAHDGTDWTDHIARMAFVTQSSVTWSTGDHPVQIRLYTCASGTATPREVLRIWPSGCMGHGSGVLTTDYGSGVLATSHLLANIPHANIYVADNTGTQSIASGTTYTQLTSFATNGTSFDCTASASTDAIIATRRGTYLVNWNGSFTPDTPTRTWRFAAFVTGVEQSQCHSKVYAQTSGVSACSSFCGTAVLTSGQQLDVRCRQDGAAANIIMEYMSLTATRIGT